jgi:hypothetical protein
LGKGGGVTEQEGDPLDWGNVEAAAEEFRAKILRLADQREKATSRSGLE